MVRLKLVELLQEKKIEPRQLVMKSGLTRQSISNLLAGMQTRIEYDTIDKLCKVLECEPGDLFEYVKEKED